MLLWAASATALLTQSTAFTLDANGATGKTSGGSWSTASDARLRDVGQSFTRRLKHLECIAP